MRVYQMYEIEYSRTISAVYAIKEMPLFLMKKTEVSLVCLHFHF